MPTITMVDNQSTNSTPNNAQSDARARAIAALAGSQQNSQQSPVVDPTSISPEEMSAVKSPEHTDNQEETQEAAPTKEEATQPEEKEEPLSTQYAVLARKEKALRAKAVAQEQQYRQREEALKTREAELSKSSTIDTSKYISIDDLKRNAFGKLSELGITYDDISQQALTAQSPEAQAMREFKQQMEDELRKVREEQANVKQTFEQQQAQQYQQALNQIRNEAKQLVSSDPTFETIREMGSVNDVVDLIERTFKEDGTLLTVEQAAQAVEDYLVEEALKISKIKKISERLKPAAPQAAPAKQQAAPGQQKQQPAQQLKTLTNSVGSTRPLSAKERALLAFKGQLNDK